jgi:hypothetical protein
LYPEFAQIFARLGFWDLARGLLDVVKRHATTIPLEVLTMVQLVEAQLDSTQSSGK